MKRLKRRSEAGFTLLELLVVIAIIGILAAIAIPQFGGYRRRGFDAEVRSSVRNLMTAQEAYFLDTDTYASGNGSDTKFTSRGYRDNPDVSITTTGTAIDFTVTGTSVVGCSAGTGVWTYDSSTGLTVGVDCS
ncbi:MAG: prepilin-type N-terminal cleavage/methylation domain-containing protein [Deltaproteobacteria bacterium]|nr:prepilin-type N-terminal cleavage/methylation domain-containing protein [Deltaproteobacteria bacterium]